jgi:hypothetical protein
MSEGGVDYTHWTVAQLMACQDEAEQVISAAHGAMVDAQQVKDTALTRMHTVRNELQRRHYDPDSVRRAYVDGAFRPGGSRKGQ